MNVLVDTSVWIDFLNGHPSPEAAVLRRLLDEHNVVTCGLIVAEIFQGLRHDTSLAPLESRLRLLDVRKRLMNRTFRLRVDLGSIASQEALHGWQRREPWPSAP